MSKNYDEESFIETYLSYFGDKNEVLERMRYCDRCASELEFIHDCDYGHLFVRETTRCLSCETEDLERIFMMN